VLRQRWALKFLEQDWKDKRCISVDETWLAMCDFRKRHWRPKNQNYSIRKKKMQPRISMIAGVSTHGDIYLALSPANTNKGMMTLFMEQLVVKLNKEDVHWRSNTVILWDGKSIRY
jgi:hypothetical protein